MSSAKPLKIPSTPAKPSSSTPTPVDNKPTIPKVAIAPSNPADITSPHELTAFVENLLERLDGKFDEMSSQILERMNQMSSRVDALEASIQDIINGDISGSSVPQSPAPGTPGGMVGHR